MEEEKGFLVVNTQFLGSATVPDKENNNIVEEATKVTLQICNMLEINHLWIPREIRRVVGSWKTWMYENCNSSLT